MTLAATYRLQLGADFTFDDAAAQVPYLARLGVTHLYLSPVLSAAPGSTHGYDVVDHDEISPALGGRAGLDRLAATARESGLGLVLDIVPNHMAVPTPAWHNRALWSVLAHGPESPYASWFDVDWSAGEGALLMPVLGSRIGTVLAAGELHLERQEVPGFGEGTVLRYFEHVFPVRPGTEDLPLAELVGRQHYRLSYWLVANEELNYRRFFDVGTLAAIRVEDPEVFAATHNLVSSLVLDGTAAGLRVDHPDGLADPHGYLQRLATATDGTWVVVEKILAPDEHLPESWPTAGTTGYEVLWRVQAVFLDPGGAAGLGGVLRDLTGDAADALPALVQAAKREVVAGLLAAEVDRLAETAADICHDDVRLRDHTRRSLRECLVELLVAADRYRYYLTPHVTADVRSAWEECLERARDRLEGDRLETLDVLAELLLGKETGSAGRTGERRRLELAVRFQQTCGAVMAKGVEDTAWYRWTHLVSLCEVGGAPERFAITPEEFHSWVTHQQRWGMTTLSTHDTKRSEDVRVRIGVLSEYASEWAELVADLTSRLGGAGRIANLALQTWAGTWDGGPLPWHRMEQYLTKAMREAKEHTSWTAVDRDYEREVLAWARAAHEDRHLRAAFTQWEHLVAPAVRAATLGVKLTQLTLPGVADVYQGSEQPTLALVDPDNRRPVDFTGLAATLDRLESGRPSGLAEEKLAVTSRALRLRRALPDALTSGGYLPLPATSGNALTFARTDSVGPRVVTIATRLARALRRLGGWGEHTVVLPAGRWHDVLGGRDYDGGARPLAELLGELPVALLVREET